MLSAYTITKNEIVAPAVHLISFAANLQFTAGQMVAITLTPSGPKRLYSIASGESEHEVSILFDLKPLGALTPALSIVKPGEQLYCSPPQGSFTCTEDRAWWIATGTGIAPFRSMLQSGLGNNKTMIHGGRFLHSFYFSNDFRKLGDNYIRCCTQESEEKIYHGRLTQYLRQLELPLSNCKYYLCGSAEMVVDTRDLLISRGVLFDNIISEIYF